LTVCNGSSEQQRHEMSGDTLAEQLAEAEALLSGLGAAVVDPRLDDLSARLFCSWTPRDGQHAMSLSPALIEALAAVGGTFWMDCYPADSEEQVAPS
jgi:hypothetical protein